MRAKIVAVLMAVGLGVTGVAMTAQAAGASNCSHSNKILKRTDVLYAVNWGGDRHYVEYNHVYFCPDCGSTVEKGEATYEAHDYEQIYYDDGRVQSYCTVCDESYFW